MNDNSVISFKMHSYTLIAYYSEGVMRINLEMNHNQDVMFVSPKFTLDYFPQDLQFLFLNYVYKLANKQMIDRISFHNGLLKIKVFIDDKMRQIPIKMKKMVEDKQSSGQLPFMLTSIVSETGEESESRMSANLLSKLSKDQYSGPRLKLMMMRQNNRMRKAITKIPELSSSSATQNIKQYPYVKPQTLHRYDKFKTQEPAPSRKSYSEGKTLYNYNNYQRSLNLKKSSKQNNLDISNKDLKLADVKDLITYDWSRLTLLNLGYNNVGSEGFRLLTSIRWPALKILYVCFNNIYKIDWNPINICFLKTLSLSGNKIKDIPKNIVQLQFLQELFIYNNRIEIIPQDLVLMEELKNLSIYGNKLDQAKNKKILVRLRSKKVQVWE